MNIKNYKAIFLDRDGTINKEVNYLYKYSDFHFIPRAEDAIKTFHDLEYLVIVITNQSGTARGYYTEEDILALHHYMEEKLNKTAIKDLECENEITTKYRRRNGYYIDAYYYCPHHPNGTIDSYCVDCNCRKPNTGMIDRALKDFKEKGIHIDISKSYIVGDKESDILTGKKAGFYKAILVRSGHEIKESNTEADMIFDDLFEFSQDLKRITDKN